MADPSTTHDSSRRAGDGSGEDAMLKAALADVPLPAGLSARLKAHIRAQYPSSPESVIASAGPQPGEPSLFDHQPRTCALEPSDAAADAFPNVLSIGVSADRPQADSSDRMGDEHGGGWLRRSILVAAVAAGICGFALLARQWTRPAEPRWLAAQCDLILVQIEQDNPAHWQPVGQTIPPALTQVQSQLARLAVIAQRPLADLGSKIDGTVYRLDAGDGRGIYLMHLKSLPAVRGLTPRFEILPTPSGGWSLAAMTVGKETFVLAATCTEQQIFTYIRRADLT